MFTPLQLALIDQAGYNGIREEQIQVVAQSLRETGLSEIDRATFEEHCHLCMIDPDCFTQDDLEHLQEILDT